MGVPRFSFWGVTALVLGYGAGVFADDFRVPSNYSTIEAALADIRASGRAGDTIIVERGSHTVNAVVDFPVIIRGEELAKTFVSGRDDAGTVFNVSASGDVAIRNLTFTSGDTGVDVSAATSVTISNNIFKLGSDAIAVNVTDLSPVAVSHNIFYDNRIGVQRVASDTVVKNNGFVSNTLGISSDGVADGVSFNGFHGNDADGLRGTDTVTVGDPLFVAVPFNDFHLKQTSPFIDEGEGTDVVDDSTADIGAYGGPTADAIPFPVQAIGGSDATAAAGTTSVDVTWAANLSYLVTHTTKPGSYKLYYDSDGSGSPYTGTDAAGGTLSSPISVGNVTSYRLANLTPAQELPAAPRISKVTPEDGALSVAWPRVANDTGYYVFYGVTDVTENKVDVGQIDTYRISGLTNGQRYKIAVSAWFQARYYINVTAVDSTDKSGRESEFGTQATIPLGSVFEGARSDEVSAYPEIAQPFPSLPNEGCFIATAAFGGVDASPVATLRVFRDRFLKATIFGRLFVKLYYRYSPPLAQGLRDSTALRSVTRLLLTPLVAIATAMTERPVVILLVVLLAGIARYCRRRVFV